MSLLKYLLLLVLVLPCRSADENRPASRALASLANAQRRIAADFTLVVSTRPNRAIIDEFEFDAALRAKFPVGTTKASVEQFLASRSWPPDVVVKPYRNFLWVRYYTVDYSPSLRVDCHTVSFRFDADNRVDGVRLLDEAFFDEAPEGTPKELLRPNKAPEPTPGTVTPRAIDPKSK